MKTRIAGAAALAAVLFAATMAVADAPKPTQAEARAKIEADILARAQAKCAKDGKVALAKHVNNAVLYSCVSADDPEYKAQESAKAAH